VSEQLATTEMLSAGIELQTAARRRATALGRTNRTRVLALLGVDAIAMLLAVIGAHAWST